MEANLSFLLSQNLDTAKASARPSTDTAHTASTAYDDEMPYWEDDGWIPSTKSGKQRTPNMIRNELQRYIDTCGETQMAVLQQLGVNNNSFRKFMNPKTYKDPWSAVQNGTYWAAAKFLEAHRNKPKTTTGKRKADDSTSQDPNKKSKKELTMEAKDLMNHINAVEAPHVSEKVIFDSCPELVKKIKAFLAQDGVTKADFLRALGGINSNSLTRFLAGKKQDQQANVTYGRAWVFFEKKRIMENAKKSKQRLKNEEEHPMGFSTNRPAMHKWVICARY